MCAATPADWRTVVPRCTDRRNRGRCSGRHGRRRQDGVGSDRGLGHLAGAPEGLSADLRAEQAAHNVAEQRDCDAERSKNRYARFWRAAYLRMADCELRQAAFREWFEKLSIRSVQTHDCVRIRSGLLAYYSRQSLHRPASMKPQPDSQFTLPLDDSTAKVRPTDRGIALGCRGPFC